MKQLELETVTCQKSNFKNYRSNTYSYYTDGGLRYMLINYTVRQTIHTDIIQSENLDWSPLPARSILGEVQQKKDDETNYSTWLVTVKQKLQTFKDDAKAELAQEHKSSLLTLGQEGKDRSLNKRKDKKTRKDHKNKGSGGKRRAHREDEPSSTSDDEDRDQKFKNCKSSYCCFRFSD